MEWVKVFESRAEADARMTEGRPQLVIIGFNRVCLIRHKNQYKAVQDSCSHNGESLSKGHINFLGEIVCPWHNYCFELSTGREILGRSEDLATYPVRIDEQGFFIGL